MSMRKVAVVGAGMTKFVRRAQETPKELILPGHENGTGFLRINPG